MIDQGETTVVVTVDGWIIDKMFDSWNDDWSHGEKPEDYVRRCNYMYQGRYKAKEFRDGSPTLDDLDDYTKALGF